jgi:hypothetical protein
MEGTTRGIWQDVLEKQCGRTISGINWQRRGICGGFFVGTVIYCTTLGLHNLKGMI